MSSANVLNVDAHGWPIWPPNDPAILESLLEVWRSGDWGRYHSDIAAECSAAIADRWQSPFSETKPHVRLCCSGTMAVELALRGVGIRAGDEVVLAAYDYPGNLRCIEALSAKPVLVDTRPNGATVCTDSLQAITSDAIKAVVVSHLYGELADIKAIRQVCDERGWALVEDACQVPGAGWIEDEQFIPIGNGADAMTLSFGGSKPLTAGCGGAVLTHHDAVAARIRTYTERPSETHSMSPLQCAALIPQLATLDHLNQRRAESVSRLRNLDWGEVGGTALVSYGTDIRSCHYKFAIQVADAQRRRDFTARCAEIGLPIGEGFRSFERTSDRRTRKPVPLPNAAQFAEQVLLIDHRALLACDVCERLKTCLIA